MMLPLLLMMMIIMMLMMKVMMIIIIMMMITNDPFIYIYLLVSPINIIWMDTTYSIAYSRMIITYL